MKTLLLTLVATSAISVHAGPVPDLKVTEVKRVETQASLSREVELIKDAKGEDIYVNIQDVPNDKYVVEVVAYKEDGTRLTTTVRRPREQEFLSLDDVAFNSGNELIAIISMRTSNRYEATMMSVNLTRKTVNTLIDVGNSEFSNRIRHDNQNLALVVSSLGSGENNTFPQILRVVDEDSGKIVRQVIIDNYMGAKLGVNSQGDLQILLAGYNVLQLMDVRSGQVSDLIPASSEHIQHEELDLSIGKRIKVVAKKQTLLFKPDDLFNGHLTASEIFPEKTGFLGSDVPDTAVSQDYGLLTVTNLADGRLLGPALRISEITDLTTELTPEQILRQGDRVILSLGQIVTPMSFMPGKQITYIDVQAKKVLRHTRDNENDFTSQMFLRPNGQLVAVEPRRYRDSFTAVDLSSNQILFHGDKDIFNIVSMTTEGRLIALRGDETLQLFVFDVLHPESEIQIKESLVSAAVRYGYDPRVSIKGGSLLIPLLEPTGTIFKERGYAKYKIE